MSEDFIIILDELSKKTGEAIDWTSQNILPQIQEIGLKFVRYELITSIIWMTLFLIPTLLLIKLLHSLFKASLNEEYNGNLTAILYDNDICATVTILSVIVIIILVILIIIQIFDIVQCIVIPEKLIFRELSRYMPR